MALQSILHDPNISTFLDQIPPNQRVITLKELIYIGIKIVTNSVDPNQKPKAKNSDNHTLSQFENKENQRFNKKEKANKKSTRQNLYKKILQERKTSKSQNQHFNTVSSKSDKIQSTLLRQISKIRMQLQTLTNKVYDHYFEQNNGQNSVDDSIEMDKKVENDYIEYQGFNQSQNIPTFSPSKLNPSSKFANNHQNPFLKQKDDFFVTEPHQREAKSSDRRRSNEKSEPVYQQQPRNRARSNIMHLDDTQVRQALYKPQNQELLQSGFKKGRTKKSHSMIEKRHQEKKKQQENFFYQQNLDKQNVKELQKFKSTKNHQASYLDYVSQDKPPKMDHFKKKAKSKIKSLVERDKLKHQQKVYEQNFQKGFEQYEYSANQLDDNEEEEEQSSEQQQQEKVQEKIQQKNSYNQHSSNQSYENSGQAVYSREGQNSKPNFGFYDSKGNSSLGSKRKEDSQSFPEEDKIDSRCNQSSFSQFSQFSMSSSNSKRQIGKISRRHHE